MPSVTMPNAVPDQLTFPPHWHRRHLLDLESLSAEEITTDSRCGPADEGDDGRMSSQGSRSCPARPAPTCSSKTAPGRETVFPWPPNDLGADTVEFSSGGSSVAKGETFVDTAKTIEAMGVDWVVTRHSTPGTPHLCSRELNCSVSTRATVRTTIQRKACLTC